MILICSRYCILGIRLVLIRFNQSNILLFLIYRELFLVGRILSLFGNLIYAGSIHRIPYIFRIIVIRRGEIVIGLILREKIFKEVQTIQIQILQRYKF